MSEEKKLDSNKNIMIAAAVVAVIVIAGAYMYNANKKETVSMSVGGHEISATFKK